MFSCGSLGFISRDVIVGHFCFQVQDEVASMRWGDFKPKLAEALIEHLRPIQTKCASPSER